MSVPSISTGLGRLAFTAGSLLKRRHATAAERIAAAVLEGAAKPLGGDAEEAVRPAWTDEEKEKKQEEQERVTTWVEGAMSEGSS